MKKEFDSQPVYSEKYLKTKVKSHNNVRTNLMKRLLMKNRSRLNIMIVDLITADFIAFQS